MLFTYNKKHNIENFLSDAEEKKRQERQIKICNGKSVSAHNLNYECNGLVNVGNKCKKNTNCGILFECKNNICSAK
jgi:hypothetical protein